MRRAILGVVILLSGCGSCSKGDPPKTDETADVIVTKEIVPRCRGEEHKQALPEDVVVGDAAIGPGGLLIGVIRNRTMSVVKMSADLATSTTIDLGPAFGDDPPPSPRWNGATPFAAAVTRAGGDAGAAKARVLRLFKLEDKPKVEMTLPQQSDESTAFDIAWSEGGALIAWDEDSVFTLDGGTSDRGLVVVQKVGDGTARRVVSPDGVDVEAPHLLPRAGGYWLAWLARKAEHAEEHAIEGPGEKRAFRWVELMTLDAKGELQGTPKRVTSEKGRVLGFELALDPNGGVVVMAQDETAAAEGGGSRIVRHLNASAIDLVDGGAGTGLAELVPSASERARWLAWTDTAEHAHITPLGPGLSTTGPASREPSLDGARVLASTETGIFVLTGMTPEKDRPHPEVRRFVCR